MRKLISALFAVAVSLNLSAAISKQDTVKILAIGNSFSVDAVEKNLYNLAASDGYCTIIGNMYIGGCSLERHYNNSQANEAAYSYRKIDARGNRKVTDNCTLEKALADEDWDYVTLQQASPVSGMFETYEPYLTELLSYVKARVPANAKFLFHQTWAYANNSTHKAFPDYGSDQMKMYDCIMDASSKAAVKHEMRIIPAGTAEQNARLTRIGDKVNRDGYHLNLVGQYTAACTWYETIFGNDVRNNSYYPDGINLSVRDAAQDAAHAAVKQPYRPTDTGHREALINYDENKIAPYQLPDALTMTDGRKVTNAKMWEKQRRSELLNLFSREEYGFVPSKKLKDIHYKVVASTDTVFAGAATRKEVNIYFTADEKQYMTLMIYVPNNAGGPVPAFLGLNFKGNFATTFDEGVLKPTEEQIAGYGGHLAKAERGEQSRRWPFKEIIARGYAVATVYSADIDPDWDDHFQNGVHQLFKGERTGDSWGTISAWAWGLSRCLDYLQTDKAIDSDKVAVIGHSRNGKTALWAGATDPRFALVISNDSGCSGAALSRRAIGENVKRINDSFPHWFCDNYKKYNDNESELPFDQHELLALIAPRPLYVASASEDAWADPKGEFLSAWHASEVYNFLGYPGLVVPGHTSEGEPELPAIESPLQEGRIGYHLRKGPHDINIYDWTQYMNFADKFFK